MAARAVGQGLSWHLVLLLLGVAGDGVDAAEPAMQVDIRAALGAERPVFFRLRPLLTDDAERGCCLVLRRAAGFVRHINRNRLRRG